MKVTFSGCSDAQATFAGGVDPRGILTPGQTYDVVQREVFDFHTHYHIEVDGKLIAFNSGCFGEWKPEELPDKLQTVVVDTLNAFLVRIDADPRGSRTGYANIIPQGADRASRDFAIAFGVEFVKRWNEGPV